MLLRRCCATLLILTGVQAAIAGPPTLVKEHGDISRLIVEGNETFTDDQIRDALDHNLELLAYNGRFAAYFQFEEALERLIREGYLSSGFVNVVVDVRFDEERNAVVASIQEEECCLCGDIEVVGVEGEVVDLIRQRLTQPFLPAEAVVVGVHDEVTGDLEYGYTVSGDLVVKSDPGWKPGEPVDAREMTHGRHVYQVWQALSELGLHCGNYDVTTDFHASDATATLRVTMQDAVVPLTIDEVSIQGAERNTADDVLDFLDLKLPVVYTFDVHRELLRKLWECGRFRHFSVRPDQADGSPVESAPTCLRIDLVEYVRAPLLTEELDEVDQILCRAAHWFTTQAGRTNDIVWSFRLALESEEDTPASYMQAEGAFSQRRGAIVDQSWLLPEIGIEQPGSFLIAIDPSRIMVRSGATGQRLAYSLGEAIQPKVGIAFVGVPEPESEEQSSLKFDAGVSTAANLGGRPELVAAPTAILDFVRGGESQATISDGVLSIHSQPAEAAPGDSFQVVFEAETGRWMRFRVLNESSVGEIRFEEQGFEQVSRGRIDIEDDDSLVTSLSTFIAREIAGINVRSDGAESLIMLAAFSTSLGERLASRNEETPDVVASRQSFQIPLTAEFGPPAFDPVVLQMAYQANSLLFPRGSTFWRLGRELVHGFAFQDNEAFGRADRILESYTAGPIMYLYAAELFRVLNPVFGQAVAREGLKRLTRRRFIDDCRQLLIREDIVADVIHDSFVTLRDMDDQQLHSLLTPFVAAEQRTALLAALRNDGSSDVDVLLSLLGELWDAKLRDIVQNRLKTLGGGPDIRNAAGQPVRDTHRHTTQLSR